MYAVTQKQVISHDEMLGIPFKGFRAVVWYDAENDQHKLILHAESKFRPEDRSMLWTAKLVWEERKEGEECSPSMTFASHQCFSRHEDHPLQELAESLWRSFVRPSKHVCNYEQTIQILESELKVKNDQIQFLQAQNILLMNQTPAQTTSIMDINHGHPGVGDPIEAR